MTRQITITEHTCIESGSWANTISEFPTWAEANAYTAELDDLGYTDITPGVGIDCGWHHKSYKVDCGMS